jgi:hypothetical protein
MMVHSAAPPEALVWTSLVVGRKKEESKKERKRKNPHKLQVR